MNQDLIPDAVGSRYNGAWLRGRRITRLEETRLEYFRLDAETAWQLGRNNVGVFVGGCQALGVTIELLQKLEQPTLAASWVIVAATKVMAGEMAQRWFEVDPPKRKKAALKLPTAHHNIILATPETLHKIDSLERGNFAGIIIVDMHCNVHRARGYQSMVNDRPQSVANFRNAVSYGVWLPPLIVLTQTPAKSVPTDVMARAYCLEAWWFVDGKSLRCGAPPAGIAKSGSAVNGAGDAISDGYDRSDTDPGSTEPS